MSPRVLLTLLSYVQGFDGTKLLVRLVLLPIHSPLERLNSEVPSSPPFARANFVLSAVLTRGLTDMPPAGTQTVTKIAAPAPARAEALFTALKEVFPIDPKPPGASPRREMTVLKHLPPSYREASGATQSSSPYARTDDCYACAHRQARTPKPMPDRKAPVAWGRVIAIALRQPLLAEALGLVRTLEVPVPAGALAKGGWLHVTLDPSGDAGVLASPKALRVFAARIAPLPAKAPLFTPVLFPVPPKGTATYDTPFAEAIEYADGFAKIVHADQQRTADPLAEAEDGTRPDRETGIRIGWDDEQVATWINRQAKVLTPTDPDTQMGVAGYRIDARELGDTKWLSLCAVKGPVKVGATNLGTFTGEQQVETHPVQLDAEEKGEFWLSAYFARWIGGSVVGGDPVGLQLAGGPAPEPGRVLPTKPGVSLAYGTTYEFRVRLADHSGGGPAPAEEPTVPAVTPTATLAFRRWVRPGKPEVKQPKSPDATKVIVRRPRLGYPAYPCTGAPNAVADLLADLPDAAAAGREPGLPDPDVTAVRIDVKARALGFDPAAADGYVTLYSATRDLPADEPLRLKLEWRDVRDADALTDPGSGPLAVPTSRDLRLEIHAVCRPDPKLEYFGAEDVRAGPPTGVDLRKEAADESGLLELGSPADFLRALYLQPDPAEDPTMAKAMQGADGSTDRPGDSVARVAAASDLGHAGLTLRSRPGRRLVIGAAAGLRHVLGPDHGSITVASRTELTRQWLVVLRARLDRDWSWDGLAADGIAVLRDGVEVGRIQPLRTLADEGEAPDADRTGTDLLFFDVVDTKPKAGELPRPATPSYRLAAAYSGSPAEADEPLAEQDVTLPITTPPAQMPRLVSVGIALSPYERSADYSSTEPRRRMLWLQFDADPEDPDDALFARVLRAVPDPLIAGSRDDEVPDQPVSLEPPLPIDPEHTRVIVPGQSDDRAGLGAMQRLIPGDTPGHYLLPLPPGVSEGDPALLGFFTYELRYGHVARWSTAQGRFGTPLRVAGVQHPAPALACSTARSKEGIVVSAPYANPIYEGVSLRPFPPATWIWALLYAQVERADRGGPQNVLVSRRVARLGSVEQRRELDRGSNDLQATASWTQYEVAGALKSIGLGPDAPLSVLAVEILPSSVPSADPMGANLGSERILRTSPLVAVADLCTCE
jgi:hypothetical protein